MTYYRHVIVTAWLKCQCMFFFFQAEDGIRDLVRSRGLGDVYKRQRVTVAERPEYLAKEMDKRLAWRPFNSAIVTGDEAVSYTHLTLPTSDLV